MSQLIKTIYHKCSPKIETSQGVQLIGLLALCALMMIPLIILAAIQ